MCGLLEYLEQKRIKLHLKRTEFRLKQVDDSRMSIDLRSRRKLALSLLNEYWKIGKFPKNTDYPNQRLPHIRDRFGTPCAMAYIVEKMGDKHIVDQLQSQNNLVYIDDVTEGPLVNWIMTSGITKKEASRIQPEYGGYGMTHTVSTSQDATLLVATAIFFAIEFGAFFILKRLIGRFRNLILALIGIGVISLLVSFVSSLLIMSYF